MRQLRASNRGDENGNPAWGPDGECVKAAAWHEGLLTWMLDGHNARRLLCACQTCAVCHLLCERIMAARMIRALSLSALLAALAAVESRKVSA